MNVTDAIQRRQATRAFLPAPVPRLLVEELLGLAARAPSGGNLQPWHVYALAGKDLEAFKVVAAARLTQSDRETAEYAIYPPDLWEPLRTRRREAGAQRYDALGITREMNGQAQLEAMNLRFFDAPIGLFFCLDRRVGPPQWADLGMFMQNFMLSAVDRGLATCPQEVWANWPHLIAEALDLPPSLMIFAGMSMGYPDMESAMNSYRTPRAEVEYFATFRGFE